MMSWKHLYLPAGTKGLGLCHLTFVNLLGVRADQMPFDALPLMLMFLKANSALVQEMA